MHILLELAPIDLQIRELSRQHLKRRRPFEMIQEIEHGGQRLGHGTITPWRGRSIDHTITASAFDENLAYDLRVHVSRIGKWPTMNRFTREFSVALAYGALLLLLAVAAPAFYQGDKLRSILV